MQPEPSPEPSPQTGPEPVVAWLPRGAAELFGEGATAEEGYGLLTVDVPAGAWIPALETARTTLGCTFFDWLSAVDEPGTGFRVCAHVAALPGGTGGTGGSGGTGAVRRLVVRTTLPHDAPALPTATGVYAGAAWHERETHEMFGIGFTGHPHLVPLLLPEGFEGHPLRKDFVLAARVAKAWPGAKEPGESAEGGPKRRQMLPPGVPDPNEWGPLKGQLPPAPTRPTRTPRTAAGTAGAERPPRRAAQPTENTAAPAPRRARSVSEGSASQAAEGAEAAPRRTRSAGDGSASQAAEGAEAAPRRTRSVSEGSASQAAEAAPRRTRSAGDGSASRQDGASEPQPTSPRPVPRSSDAPWHHARPAFSETSATPDAPTAENEPGDADAAAGGPGSEPDSSRRSGEQPARRSPAVPNVPDREAPGTAGAAAEAGDVDTDAAGSAEPDSSRRSGEQPARRSPAVPNVPDREAPGAAGAAAEPRDADPAAGSGGSGGGGGESENDTNPAGGEPA
ncbi:NADH-quinone oxidoreductase subunit C [Streptomyces sp. NPDC026206]|uniref:NADH-quinone oxidoreductase subunit C n=1 Tax=Streptomyces sp. NPDC026206 TaxID=3157089 RepID=UPI0033F67A0A